MQDKTDTEVNETREIKVILDKKRLLFILLQYPSWGGGTFPACSSQWLWEQVPFYGVGATWLSPHLLPCAPKMVPSGEGAFPQHQLSWEGSGNAEGSSQAEEEFSLPCFIRSSWVLGEERCHCPSPRTAPHKWGRAGWDAPGGNTAPGEQQEGLGEEEGRLLHQALSIPTPIQTSPSTGL